MTEQQLPDRLHELYDAEVRVQVHPSRGMNELAGAARSVRRRAMMRSGLAGVAGAVMVGALVVGGLKVFGETAPPATSPTGTASPTANTVDVTWNPGPAARAVLADVPLPQCGNPFAPEEQTAGNVRAVAQAEYGATISIDDRDEPQFAVHPQFASTDGAEHVFVGSFGGYVITRDGVVVAVGAPSESMDLFTTGEASSWVTPVFAADGCEGLAEWPAGTYQVYVVTPVLFGDQLAAAQAAQAAGVHDVAMLRGDVGSTPLGEDERLVPYCYGEPGSQTCNVPEDLLNDVLTFAVDPATIDPTPGGIAISAPVTVIVP